MYGEEKMAEILFTEDQISRRCRELGKQLTEDYKDRAGSLLLVGLLKGSIPFMAELSRRIELPVQMDYMYVTSYDGMESLGDIQINMDLRQSIVGLDILLVEDIVDTGTTISHVRKLLFNKGAADVKVVTLLDKPSRRTADVKPDYVGFSIPDKFVVGYGMDYNQDYRNLPYIAVLKPEVYEKAS